MRKYILILLCGSALVTVGCQNKTQTGAATGAVVGAGLGNLLGGDTKATIIGGVIGAGIGGAIGYNLDGRDRSALEDRSPRTVNRIDRKQQLFVSDVIAMTESGISEDVIVSQIESTKSVFYLTTQQIISLKNQGVGQRVIDRMIQTGRYND